MKTLVFAFLLLTCVALLVSGYPYEDRQYLGGHGVRLSYDNRGYGRGYGGGGGYGRGYGGGYGSGGYGGYGGYDKY